MRSIYDQCMSQNLYTYVGNNPINYVDPTGHTRTTLRYRDDGSSGNTGYNPRVEKNKARKRAEANNPTKLIDGEYTIEYIEIVRAVYGTTIKLPFVRGMGLSIRGIAGVSGSFGVFYVWDGDGNSGLMIAPAAGGGWGFGAAAGIEYISGKNLTNIHQLEGMSTVLGGAIGEAISGGYERGIIKGEDEPLLFNTYSLNACLYAPAPLPGEFHFEIGHSWILFDD